MRNAKVILGLAAVLTLATTSPAQSFLTNGLAAWYPFNSNAHDASGNGNNGFTNGVVNYQTGLNSSLITSTNGNIYVSNSPTLNFSTGATFSVWFQFSQPPTNVSIFEKGCPYDTNNSYMLYYTGGALRPHINTRNGWRYGDYSFNPTLGTWVHFLYTFTSAAGMQAYLNGQNVTLSGSSLPLPGDTFFPTTAPLLFARDVRDASFTGFTGLIRNVRLFNRALASNEVAQLYAYESNFVSLHLTQDLTNRSVVAGQNINLGVTAAGSSPLYYQWYFNGGNGGALAGAYAQIISGFVYGAVVTNGGSGYGNITSVSFTGGGGSDAAGYATASNGVVTGITVTNAGGGYTNVPSVVIGAPIGYLYGQTNSTLSISNAGANNAGNYYVVVSDGTNSVTSSVVSLTLLYPPSIVQNPAGFTGSLHASNSLSVVAAGTPPLAYQWMLNGTNLYNATNASYNISNLNLTNAGAYLVQVINAYGFATSSIANAVLLPSLTTPFAGAIGLWGQNTVLGVGAVGSGSLNYQWYFNGVAIPGASGSSYALNSIQFTNAGLYSVVVSSTYGSVTNTAYQVVVNPANTTIGTFPGIYINGTVGYTYGVQSTTNLADTNAWVTVTNLTLGLPVMIWTDTNTDISQPGYPRKFYRVVAGQ